MLQSVLFMVWTTCQCSRVISIFSWNSSMTTQESVNPAQIKIKKESVNPILQYWVAPIKDCYLVLLLNYYLNKRNWFKKIKDWIYFKFQGWRTKLLSQARWLTLLKYAATTLSSYTISVFVFYKFDWHAMNMLLWSFFWAFDENKKEKFIITSVESDCKIKRRRRIETPTHGTYEYNFY